MIRRYAFESADRGRVEVAVAREYPDEAAEGSVFGRPGDMLFDVSVSADGIWGEFKLIRGCDAVRVVRYLAEHGVSFKSRRDELFQLTYIEYALIEQDVAAAEMLNAVFSKSDDDIAMDLEGEGL